MGDNKQSVEELGNETYVDDFNEFDPKAFARDVSPNGHVFTEPELQAYKQSIREETLTLGSEWPLLDILQKLNEAAEILLKEKDYDGHGYEEIVLANRQAEEYLQQLKQEWYGNRTNTAN